MSPFRALQGLRILLVEDNPGDADLVRAYLDEAGMGVPELSVVATLNEATAALERGQTEGPDAVLLDLDLPDSGGLDTLRAVLESDPTTPVIVLTGAAESETGVEAVRFGAQDFLPKDELAPLVLGRTLLYGVERKRATEQLRRSRNRFRATFRAGPYGLVVGEAGVIQQVNPQMSSMFGYEPEELVGQRIEVLVPEALREDHLALRKAYEADPRRRPMGADLRLRARRKDGTEFPVEISLSPYRESGETKILAVIQDISDRVDRERRIRFQADLLDAVGEAVIATDLEGRIEYWNRAAEELYGWSEEEVLGRNVEDVTIPETTREQGREILRALREGESWRGEFRVRRKDGSTFPALVTDSPIQGPDGELEGIIGVSADITPLVEARRELARMNRALRVRSLANRAVLQSSSEEEMLEEVCRIAVDEGGYRLAWVGYAEDDAEKRVRPVAWRGGGDAYVEALDVRWSSGPLGQGPSGSAIRTLQPSVTQDIASNPAFEPWRAEALEHGFRSSIAVPLVDRDECLGCLNIYAEEPHAFDEQEMTVLSELGADLARGLLIHRARRRERDLEKRLQEAAKLRAVGQLAGGVAHDFNNYLTVITTLADILLEDPEIHGEKAEDLREILAAAERSSLLTRQLLTFGQRDVRVPKVLDLNQTVEESTTMLRRLLGEKVTIELDLMADLPAVLVDRGQLEQVVTNLAINARDAMPSGGRLTIRTERRAPRDKDAAGEGGADGDRVVLEVVDSGVGMSAETRDRIFEPFFTTKETGTGLGLATVYGIVEEAGGSIEVESEPGAGTVFRVFLPGVADRSGAATVESPSGQSEGSRGGSETVLLVDDEGSVRSVCRRILEGRGYRVLEAASMREALARSRGEAGEIDLALVDVVLPDGPGPELARELMEDRPELALVFSSGYSVDDLGRDLSGEGRAAYLEKPYDPEALVRVLREVLDERAEARRKV